MKSASSHIQGAPIDFGDDQHYRQWRDARLAAAPFPQTPLLIRDPWHLLADERAAIAARVRDFNMLWYRFADGVAAGADAVQALGRQIGLRHLDANLYAEDDGVSAIRVKAERGAGDFIPYTDRAINWHTDGYYNPPARRVRAFILHCVAPAASGGENWLLDNDRVYIDLRDRHPEFLRALMAGDAFAIPPVVVDGREHRGWSSGPVFCIDESTGLPYMRYSARQRNVRWADDPVTRAAAAHLLELIDTHPDVVRLTLSAGEGLISNNVLHARTAFQDGDRPRLLLRARYYDRIAVPAMGAHDAVA